MGNALAVARREFRGYFATPVGYVFIVIFVAIAGALPFYAGSFFERREATLENFFVFHTWLYLLLVPAVAMRLWAEERKTGTIELLLTLPVSPAEAVIGKFLAAWGFIAVALVCTFPMWITVNVLGAPDNGVIAASYLGSFFMAGAFLAIGSCMSAMTGSQVVAFILAAAVCFILTMSGLDLVLDWVHRVASPGVVDFVADLSFLNRFSAITKGVLKLSDVVFFLSTIAFWLFATVVAVDVRRGA
jgi:CcmB protein.